MTTIDPGDIVADLRTREGAVRTYCQHIIDYRPARETLPHVAVHVLTLLNTPTPATWPPQPGDVWSDHREFHWRADLDAYLGELVLKHDVSPSVQDVASPEWAWAVHGPLALISRTANPATERPNHV